MIEEVNYFRKRFLGGFNREDVVKYINKLAKERKDLREAKEAADEETRAIAAEIEPLRKEIEEVREKSELSMIEKNTEIQGLADEIAVLRLELDEAKRTGDEHREAQEKAEQAVRNLTGTVSTLQSELDEARREAEEGRRRIEEADAKMASYEAIKQTLADIGSKFESLRTTLA